MKCRLEMHVGNTMVGVRSMYFPVAPLVSDPN